MAEHQKPGLLIVLGGLPGVGKSTIAAMLARCVGATYLRIDSIEQALRTCATLPDGVITEGYAVAYRIAEDNLRTGGAVIADSVNPLPVTRDAWVAAAARATAQVLEVEFVCSDVEEHRRRVETRSSDVPGMWLPTWQQVQARDYQAWDRPRLVVDTAGRSAEAALADVLAGLPGPKSID